MKRKLLLVCALLLLLILTQSVPPSVLAGSSPNYRIDWTNSLTGGGRISNSAGYQVHITVGQTVSRSSQAPHYTVKLGYWGGLSVPGTFLPAIQRGP